MRLLVTAGPTREYLDSVRFLSNASSGKMGFSIAAEAARRGHEVVLVSGPVDLAAPPRVRVIRVVTAAEMFAAAVREFQDGDAAVMAAAVCDFRPRARMDKKLEKRMQSLALELEPTEDICAFLGANKGSRVVVGFALEDHDHRAHAESKRERKKCDAIVLNQTSNLAADSGAIEILVGDVWRPILQGTKAELAKRVVDLVEELVNSSPSSDLDA
jgi:phosphopantothenoylcysteine decarboxylase/phosphopantothenate--cysteine ligase